MWQLLKTEIKYNTLMIIVALSLMLANIFFLIQVWRSNIEREAMESFFLIMIGIIPFIILAKLWILRVREKRDRIHAVLPIGPLEVSFVRSLIVFIPWCCAILIMLLAYLVIPDVWNEMGEPIVKFALVTMVYVSAVFLSIESKANNSIKEWLFTAVLVILGASLPILYFYFDVNNIVANSLSFIFTVLILFCTTFKFSRSNNYLR